MSLYVPTRFFDEAAEHYRRAGQRACAKPLAALAFADPLVGHCALALLRAMTAGAPDLYAETTVQWLATHLLSAHCGWRGIDAGDRNPGVIADPRLARVIERMSARFDEAMTLDALAAEAGVSKFHFTRLFRASTGCTPHAFLVRLRMQAARHRLATTELSVAGVAAQCGFATATHFSTAFASRFGISPAAYRAQLRG